MKTEFPTSSPCATSVVSVATLEVNDLFITRTGFPEWMKLCAVGPGTMNSFVNAFAEVPHFTNVRKTKGSVEGVHFIATERASA